MAQVVRDHVQSVSGITRMTARVLTSSTVRLRTFVIVRKPL